MAGESEHMTGQAATILGCEPEADMTDQQAENETSQSLLAGAAQTLARLLGCGELLSVEEARDALDSLKLAGDVIHADLVNDPNAFAEQWNAQRYLYFGLPDTLSLEESVYKSWTTDSSHPFPGKPRDGCARVLFLHKNLPFAFFTCPGVHS